MTRASRLFAKTILLLMAAGALCTLAIYWRIYGYAKLFGDFDVFYQAARHAVSGELRAVYGVPRLRELLQAEHYDPLTFFLNPPTGLLIIYPLAFFSKGAALFLWSAFQALALCFAVSRKPLRGLFHAPGAQQTPGAILLCVALPAFCMQAILFGQAAMLCAALFLLAFAWRKDHPLGAGIALGLLSFKPQLGILLPLLLLAEKNWKALIVAALTAALMAALAMLLFGAELWQEYRETLSILGGFLARPQSGIFALYLSSYGALRNLGAGSAAAMAGQLVVSLAALAALWPALKAGTEGSRLSALVLATYLASPYSLIYDIPLLALPCALLLRRAEADEATLAELGALLLLVALPLLTIPVQLMHVPYGVIAIAVAFGVARRSCHR